MLRNLKMKLPENTPGTEGGPGGHDRTLAVKSRKTLEKQHIFVKKRITTKNILCLHISSTYANTPGTAGGPGGNDRTLGIKSRKTAGKNTFFS